MVYLASQHFIFLETISSYTGCLRQFKCNYVLEQGTIKQRVAVSLFVFNRKTQG